VLVGVCVDVTVTVDEGGTVTYETTVVNEADVLVVMPGAGVAGAAVVGPMVVLC